MCRSSYYFLGGKQLKFLVNVGPLGALEVVVAGVNFFNIPINSRLHLSPRCTLYPNFKTETDSLVICCVHHFHLVEIKKGGIGHTACMRVVIRFWPFCFETFFGFSVIPKIQYESEKQTKQIKQKKTQSFPFCFPALSTTSFL